MRSGLVALGAVAALLVLPATGSGAAGAAGARERQLHPEAGLYVGHAGHGPTVQFHGSGGHVHRFMTATHEFGGAVVDEGKFHACNEEGCMVGHWTDSKRVVGAWRVSGPGHHWHHYVAEWQA